MAKRRSAPRAPMTRKRYFLRKLIILLVFAGIGLFGYVFLQGKVIGISDGDTITVLTQQGGSEKIRLYGIDCPEMDQAYGPEAKDVTSSLAMLKDVKVQAIERDQYGRTVAIVTLPDGRVLNQELVAQGYAMVYERYCKRPQCLGWKALEKEAGLNRRGLWSDKKPVPPWVWRQATHKNR